MLLSLNSDVVSIKKKSGPEVRPASQQLRVDIDYGRGVVFVPVYGATPGVQPGSSGGQTSTPPAGAIGFAGTPVVPTAGEQPLPSHAASKSTVRRLPPAALPNISTMTQFLLGRGPVVPEPAGARLLVLPGPVMMVGMPPTLRVTEYAVLPRL